MIFLSFIGGGPVQELNFRELNLLGNHNVVRYIASGKQCKMMSSKSSLTMATVVHLLDLDLANTVCRSIR